MDACFKLDGYHFEFKICETYEHIRIFVGGLWTGSVRISLMCSERVDCPCV